MPDDQYIKDRSITNQQKPSIGATEKTGKTEGENRSVGVWENLNRLGIANFTLRTGMYLLLIVLVIAVSMAMRNFFFYAQESNQAKIQATAQAIAAPTLIADSGAQLDQNPGVVLPDYPSPSISYKSGISRKAILDTTIPNRPRVEISTYEVKFGDNLFMIADKFGLKPETILWGNYEVLQDNPQFLSEGQILNILPTDGVYYKWNTGENLLKVAEFFKVEPDAIIEWPGNELDPYEINVENPGISDGTWLIIPDGKRALKDWGPPAISRSNPASAAYYGPGHCGSIIEGAIGIGTFVWPTTSRTISGYHYDPVIHPAIDIGGEEGNAIFATDGGVVVYSGWSNWGYGYLIVIDHGTGWQSAYAHLSGIGVVCGSNVGQGMVIGALGNTGNSSGAHLHFEMRSEIYGKVNPLNYLIP
jgi:murein DD-endopeptidase MepM/ murein hydrolase activator NlpD